MNATEYHGNSSSSSPSPTTGKRSNYDLEDDEADLVRWPKLKELLVVLGETLLPVYQAADKAALRQQKRHSWLVILAAIFGTLAVLCALLELREWDEVMRATLSILEVISAYFAVIVVGLGIYTALHPEWLLQRFLAEQCRFVKFHLLLNPQQWVNRSPTELRRELDEIVQLLNQRDDRLIRKWVTWHLKIAKRFSALPNDIPEDTLKQIIDYYREKRLVTQQQYFEGEADKRYVWERWTRHVSPICFYLSIGFAFAHFMFERWADKTHVEWLHGAAHICVILAAAFPVLAMGVRTFRTAHEFGRNHLRFEGMSHFLKESLELSQSSNEHSATIAILREAETALDSEHRAWLRLMIEAEWFG